VAAEEAITNVKRFETNAKVVEAARSAISERADWESLVVVVADVDEDDGAAAPLEWETEFDLWRGF
jgi:hypothetical protein